MLWSYIGLFIFFTIIQTCWKIGFRDRIKKNKLINFTIRLKNKNVNNIKVICCSNGGYNMSRKIKIVLNKTNNIILLYFNTMFTKYEFINLKMYYY